MPHRSRSRKQSSLSSSAGTLASTAAVVYGAYRLYEWATDDCDASIGDNREETYDGASSSLLGSWMSSVWGTSNADQSQPAPSSSARSNLDPRTQWKLRRQRIKKCRQEVLRAHQSCLPALRETIEKATGTASATKELKALRQKRQEQPKDDDRIQTRQDELWQEVVQETLTRVITGVYASSLLLLSLTVQINYVGGKLFANPKGAASANRSNPQSPQKQGLACPSYQKLLTGTHNYFLTQGLPLLLTTVRQTIIESGKTATSLMSKQDLFHWLSDRVFQKLRGHGSMKRNWIRWFLPEDEGDDEDDGMSLDTLWDLCQSPAWEDATVQAISLCWTSLMEDCDMVSQKLPLAKAMGPLKQSCGSVVFDSQSHLLEDMQKLPSVQELASFSFQ